MEVGLRSRQPLARAVQPGAEGRPRADHHAGRIPADDRATAPATRRLSQRRNTAHQKRHDRTSPIWNSTGMCSDSFQIWLDARSL